MPFQDTQLKSTLWAPIDLSSSQGVFTHIQSIYQTKGLTVKVIPELKELLSVPQENTLGIIIAYKDTQKPDTQVKNKHDPTSVTFSPHLRYGHSLLTSALLDIIHNTDVGVVSLYDQKSIDGHYRFVSYVCKGKKLYELDGIKENPVLVSNVSDHTGEQANWLRLLVDHLEKTTDQIEFQCVSIMRTPDRGERIEARRDTIKELIEQLKLHVTPQGRYILEKLQGFNFRIAAIERKLNPQPENDAPSSSDGSTSSSGTSGSDEGSGTEDDVQEVSSADVTCPMKQQLYEDEALNDSTTEQGTVISVLLSPLSQEENKENILEAEPESINPGEEEELASIDPGATDPEEVTTILEITSSTNPDDLPGTGETDEVEITKHKPIGRSAEEEEVRTSIKRKHNDDGNNAKDELCTRKHRLPKKRHTT